MKLYFSPFACSLAARIAIYESDLDCEFEQVDLMSKKTASGNDFRDISAKAKVAALELDDGTVLTENPVILEYIYDLSRCDKNNIDNGLERYRIQEALAYVSSEIHKQIVYPCALSDKLNIEVSLVPMEPERQFSYLEQLFSSQEYLTGSYTVADAYLFWALTFLSTVGTSFDNYVAIKRYLQRIESRESVQRALSIETDMLENT